MYEHIVKNFDMEYKDGKTIIYVYREPKYIKTVDGYVKIEEEYADVIDVEDYENMTKEQIKKEEEYMDLIRHFSFKGNPEKIILDGIIDEKDIDIQPRTYGMERKEEENGIRNRRAAVWIDGAENTSGVVYFKGKYIDTVHYHFGSNDDVEIKKIEEYEEGMEKPYWVKEGNYVKVFLDGFSGTSTSQSEYVGISTPQDFYLMRNDNEGYYEILNDIDFSGIDEWEAVFNNDTFRGELDGNNFTLHSFNGEYLLYSVTSTRRGGSLLGSCISYKILNLKVRNFDVKYNNIHVLSGIFHSDSNPSISSIENLDIEMNLKSLSSDSNSFGISFIGGRYNGHIYNCFFKVKMKSQKRCGMFNILAGSNLLIKKSSFVSEIESIAPDNCSFSRFIFSSTNGTLDNVKISGHCKESPIKLFNDSGSGWSMKVDNCYIAVDSSESPSVSVTDGAGSDSQFNSCYIDSDLTGITSDPYFEPKTTQEMKQQSTYIGWDFEETWTMNTADGYPGFQDFQFEEPPDDDDDEDPDDPTDPEDPDDPEEEEPEPVLYLSSTNLKLPLFELNDEYIQTNILRIGTNKGILCFDLVETNHEKASKFRVGTSEGVKAIRKE